jgi:hypothetical protein
MPGWSIRGIQEAQQANEHNIAQLKPSGAYGRMIRDVTTYVHRYVVTLTHVITGSLRASHRMDVQSMRASIYIDPDAVNPKSGNRPADYGPFEEARGGEHAFYYRGAFIGGPEAVATHSRIFIGSLK